MALWNKKKRNEDKASLGAATQETLARLAAEGMGFAEKLMSLFEHDDDGAKYLVMRVMPCLPAIMNGDFKPLADMIKADPILGKYAKG